MMESSLAMRSTFLVALFFFVTSTLCYQVETKEINVIEKVGITSGISPRFNEMEEWCKEVKRYKRNTAAPDANRLQNVNLNCKNTVQNLTTIFRRTTANAPQPAGDNDVATLTTARKIERAITNASQQLEEECAWRDSINMPVEATRAQFLTTEVDDMGAEGLVIYQIRIQRLDFEDPYARPKRP
ncbi:uncharacterized protein LOC130686496 [Daphnia carinata]|uniref:uncharacterized protein LOC130686496 n=1 Tax=Daphnia carinata TaxID=120202 RepID=UPI00286851AC|nr:uncharacterized protein LOC130686496 [Daphnia carinata]XP_059353669.1 uncharacterized protein LOC130686496 [Daphnia carinata]